MKLGEKLVLVAGITLTTAAFAVTADSNPYQGIVDRNVFGLKPPPPPPDPAELNKPQPVNITLTGITTILGKARALMKTPAPPGKPGEAPKGEQSYILMVGQREGDIEVLAIDDKENTVKVRNAGREVTLNFKDNGPKIAQAAPPVAVPGAGAPGVIPPPVIPAANPAVSTPNPSFGLPNRPMRAPSTGSAASAYTPSGVPATGASSGGLGFGMAPSTISQTSTPNISPEDQLIGMEVMREKNKNNPNFPPLPPTILSPSQNTTPNQTGSGAGGNTSVMPPLPPGSAGRPWAQ